MVRTLSKITVKHTVNFIQIIIINVISIVYGFDGIMPSQNKLIKIVTFLPAK